MRKKYILKIPRHTSELVLVDNWGPEMLEVNAFSQLKFPEQLY